MDGTQGGRVAPADGSLALAYAAMQSLQRHGLSPTPEHYAA
jgi:hypothetical protein